MADTQTTVTTVDIQLLDAERSGATTVKLDNPKNNLTREQISAAMQPALSNGWFLTNKGNVVMYIGDTTINQSIKTKLGGEDFYVTPSSLSFGMDGQGTSDTKIVTVTGAVIQGYNITDENIENINSMQRDITVAENGLTITITIKQTQSTSPTGSFNLKLVIQGTIVTIPCSVAHT